MMKFVALWNLPEDASEAEFERWYRGTHIADAKRIPGLRRYTVNRACAQTQASSAFYRMAELSFDSYEAAQHALASPEWQHALRDASGRLIGHVRLFFDSEEIPLDG
jgi:uncharacterized protein (TIGR02118 family)